MRRNILFFTIMLCFVDTYAQIKNEDDLYKGAINEQVKYELQSSSFSKMGIYFVNNHFTNTKLDYPNVDLYILNKDKLKSEAKKGIDLIEVYPLRLIDGKIVIETKSIFRKRKKITMYGNSIYYFKYDCNKKSYVLIDKKQKMI